MTVKIGAGAPSRVLQGPRDAGPEHGDDPPAGPGPPLPVHARGRAPPPTLDGIFDSDPFECVVSGDRPSNSQKGS